MAKRIFISDIHMGDSRGLKQGNGVHRYCWFYDGRQATHVTENRPEMLTTFLKQHCLDDGNVQEVVVIRDLLDQWVCPVDYDPTDPAGPMPPLGQQFKNIASAQHNVGVTEALRKLASEGRLKYLPGNHDMLADKKTMAGIFPGLDYIDPLPGEEGHSVYKTPDGIWAEHGHWYGLFNAPYPRRFGQGFSNSILPLGFFMTRVIAEEALNTGNRVKPAHVFWDWLKEISGKGRRRNIDAILMELLTVFVENYGGNHADILCNGTGEIPGSVSWNDVRQRYRRIYNEWSGTHHHNVEPMDAIACDAGSLWYPARKTLFEHDKDVKIVIFGHTHGCELVPVVPANPGPADPPWQVRPLYANTGAWAYDVEQCTFVETEFDPKRRRHFVRRMKWVWDNAAKQYKARGYGAYWEDYVDT